MLLTFPSKNQFAPGTLGHGLGHPLKSYFGKTPLSSPTLATEKWFKKKIVSRETRQERLHGNAVAAIKGAFR